VAIVLEAGSESQPKKKPRMPKAHSQFIADLYVRAGCVIRTEFQTDPNDEAYEYLLVWPHNDDPVYPALPR